MRRWIGLIFLGCLWSTAVMAQQGKETFIGVAENGKMFAELATENNGRLLVALDAWPEETVGKRLKVMGTFERMPSVLQEGEQGYAGDVMLLDDVTWQILP